jgi:hypothetical protein
MLRHCCVFLLIAGVALAARAKEQVSPQVAIVARMYRDFAWEAVVVDPRPNEPTFMDQSTHVLARYLDPQLVRLVVADRACVARRREICNLDFSPIWASQDPAATGLKVLPGNQSGTVDVLFIYPIDSKPIRLRYEIVDTQSGPRIRDIHYADGPSLLAILRRKN